MHPTLPVPLIFLFLFCFVALYWLYWKFIPMRKDVKKVAGIVYFALLAVWLFHTLGF